MGGVTIASMGVSVHNLDNLLGFGDINLALFAIPFTAIAITGLCNVYNMVDSIDGLAGSLTLVANGSLLYLSSDGPRQRSRPSGVPLCVYQRILSV